MYQQGELPVGFIKVTTAHIPDCSPQLIELRSRQLEQPAGWTAAAATTAKLYTMSEKQEARLTSNPRMLVTCCTDAPEEVPVFVSKGNALHNVL